MDTTFRISALFAACFLLIVLILYFLFEGNEGGTVYQLGDTPVLQMTVIDSGSRPRTFRLGIPVQAGREVRFMPDTQATNAFSLPLIYSESVEFDNQFVGDVGRGGSCNVELISYVPHSVTHIEASSHILSYDSGSITVSDIPQEHLTGLAYLADLSHLSDEPGRLIEWAELKEKLDGIVLPVSMLALKTKGSLLPIDYDFSGKDYLAVDPATASEIHDYSHPSLQIQFNCLLLDLPSTDKEYDDGKLLAHRRFFGIPETGHSGTNNEKRAIVELADFSELDEGYYFVVITPSRFQTNAVSTGVSFWPLEELR
ncbi:cyclase family protein [candidate division KSB1 bacterium]